MDSDLIEACLGGKAFAWDALIERYQALIYSVLLKSGLQKGDADDIFQEVCIILMKHLSSIRERDKLGGWIISTAKREVWRSMNAKRETLHSEIGSEAGSAEAVLDRADERPNPEQMTIGFEEQAVVVQAMTQISESCSRLLKMLYHEDPPESYANISKKLGIPTGSIGPTRARCLQSLLKKMKEIGF